MWCVVVYDLETSRIGAPYIYDISNLRVKYSSLRFVLKGLIYARLYCTLYVARNVGYCVPVFSRMLLKAKVRYSSVYSVTRQAICV